MTHPPSEVRYRISEVAALTGFTPSALRFYEHAGVLAPPERTGAGYRTYGDRDVERLRLVARAKDLGCTLDEIAGLVEAWDADRCAPVKHRLRALVDAKVAEAERRAGEQASFAAQLRAASAALAQGPVDGPCDPTCGCADLPAERPTAENACAEDAPPVVCSLTGDGMAARVGEWAAVLAQVTERAPLRAGVRLVLGGQAPAEEVVRLAVAEQACCPFFSFALTVDRRGTALEVTAPPAGQQLLHALFAPI